MKKGYKRTIEDRLSISKRKTIDLIGRKFGKLTVIGQSDEREKRGTKKWDSICDCGNKHTVSGGSLRHGRSTHCGCNRKEPKNKNNNREEQIWKHLYCSTRKKRSKKNGIPK